MDLVTYSPTSKGFALVFIIVERFSKYISFIPFKATCTAPNLAKLLYDYIVCKFGMPKKKLVTGVESFCPSSGRPSFISYSVLWQYQVVIALRQLVNQSAFIILLSRYSISM